MNPRNIVKKIIPRSLFSFIEPYGHWAEAIIWNIVYGFPGRNLKVIGVTGTNGKTTTSYLIHNMLSEAGLKSGLMSTVGYGVGKDIKPQIQHMTTVSVPLLMKRMRYMESQGVEWLVLETTSHALAQHRVWRVPFSVAVFTNLTHEHLDYHRTFKRYRDAKRRLFKQTNKNHKGFRVGIINADDPNAKYFAKDIKTPIMYGIKKGDIQAKNIKLSDNGLSYQAVCSDEIYNINCQIPGSFNVENSLAVVCVGRVLKLTKNQIETGIASLSGVEGRMTTVNEGQDFVVIVDFAHTPDSFEKLFKDIKPVVKGRLIVMFGSAGRRDIAKRAVQGKLAGKYADIVVITEEDDRDVDGLKIMDQIASGAESEGKIRDKDLFLVHDRTEAIEFSLKKARTNDTILLLGKGHEKTIERADGEHEWHEIQTTKDILKKLNKS